MAIQMRHLLKVEGWPEVQINGCEACGYIWVQLLDIHKKPERCPSRDCRTRAWDGSQKRKEEKRGRPDKLMLSNSSGERPILDGYGTLWQGEKHHALCPCLLCLRAMGQPWDELPRAKSHPGVHRGVEEKPHKESLCGTIPL